MLSVLINKIKTSNLRVNNTILAQLSHTKTKQMVRELHDRSLLEKNKGLLQYMQRNFMHLVRFRPHLNATIHIQQSKSTQRTSQSLSRWTMVAAN